MLVDVGQWLHPHVIKDMSLAKNPICIIRVKHNSHLVLFSDHLNSELLLVESQLGQEQQSGLSPIMAAGKRSHPL